MSNFITTKDGVDIFYKDWGSKDAQPIMFHHGWPLSSDDWDAQMLFFLSKGYRVVAHDRRGHGRSAQVDVGHDMAHYAADAAAVAEYYAGVAEVKGWDVSDSMWQAKPVEVLEQFRWALTQDRNAASTRFCCKRCVKASRPTPPTDCPRKARR